MPDDKPRDEEPRKPTPFEKEIDELAKFAPQDVLKVPDRPQYCSGCGARSYSCWCGQSRIRYRYEP